MGKFYMVSQNQSYREERGLGVLFAPNERAGGGPPLSHWLTMDSLSDADVIFCAYRKKIVSVAIPKGPSTIAERPEVIPGTSWGDRGWVCHVQYHDLTRPVGIYSELDLHWRVGEGRFDRDGDVTQQYLVELSVPFSAYFMATFGDRLPASIIGLDTDSANDDASFNVPFTIALERASKSSTVRNAVNTTAAVTLAHGKLLMDYASHVEGLYGYRPTSRAYRTSVTSSPLRADAVDIERALILEVKPVLTVDEMYRAIGQLVIYQQLDEYEYSPAILVDERPRSWFLRRLRGAGIACVWRTSDGFADNAGGQFA